MKRSEFIEMCICECADCGKFQTRWRDSPWDGMVGRWICHCIGGDDGEFHGRRMGFIGLDRDSYKIVPDLDVVDYFCDTENYRDACPYYVERYVSLLNIERTEEVGLE